MAKSSKGTKGSKGKKCAARGGHGAEPPRGAVHKKAHRMSPKPPADGYPLRVVRKSSRVQEQNGEVDTAARWHLQTNDNGLLKLGKGPLGSFEDPDMPPAPVGHEYVGDVLYNTEAFAWFDDFSTRTSMLATEEGRARRAELQQQLKEYKHAKKLLARELKRKTSRIKEYKERVRANYNARIDNEKSGLTFRRRIGGDTCQYTDLTSEVLEYASAIIRPRQRAADYRFAMSVQCRVLRWGLPN